MGSLIINHNISAINTHRNLQAADKRVKASLEHLSSGEKIVRAADGPATLMISEQMRAQIASVSQAIRNSETSVSMVQTTEASLNEVNQLLLSVRQLAIHAANEGANDERMLEADQLEVTNALQSIDRISQFAEFGTKKLLDGSRSVTGVAAGRGLTFLKASEKTRGSPDEGYEVRISQGATKSQVIADFPLTQDVIDSGVKLTIQESGRIASHNTKPGEDIRVVIQRLQTAVDLNGLQVEVARTFSSEPDVDPAFNNRLIITHREFGTKGKFTVISNQVGLLSSLEGMPEMVNNGFDVEGTINGQLAFGKGRVLTAAEGTEAAGLEVLYEGPTPPDPQVPVGRVTVSQNSLIFQIGPNVGQRIAIALGSVSSRTMGVNIDNESGYQNLSEVDVRTAQGAEDTMRLVDKAISDVNEVRARLGAVQKNSLESNIRSLQVAREELTNSESVLRDADMALEISDLTRNQIILQSGMAMLGQANQSARNVLSLLQAG
ncbi:MAG: flagellin [SAR324 cluster bacterium]|nr:flagellin [SAR324 cluster bacterium]